MGVNFEVQPSGILVKKPVAKYRAAKIKTNIYPGLMSDYIPPFAVLATQAEGTSSLCTSGCTRVAWATFTS